VIGAKYKLDKLTVYGGYEYSRLSSPTDFFKYNPTNSGTAGNVYNFNNSWTDYPAQVQKDAFGHGTGKPEDLQVVWIGAKYGILSNLDAAVGYYHEWQNNYDTSSATNCAAFSSQAGNAKYVTTSKQVGQGTIKGDCAGHTDVISGMLDWRPVKRVDIYGGVMFSKVEGGMASGYIHDTNTSVTGGVRVNF